MLLLHLSGGSFLCFTFLSFALLGSSLSRFTFLHFTLDALSLLSGSLGSTLQFLFLGRKDSNQFQFTVNDVAVELLTELRQELVENLLTYLCQLIGWNIGRQKDHGTRRRQVCFWQFRGEGVNLLLHFVEVVKGYLLIERSERVERGVKHAIEDAAVIFLNVGAVLGNGSLLLLFDNGSTAATLLLSTFLCRVLIAHLLELIRQAVFFRGVHLVLHGGELSAYLIEQLSYRRTLVVHLRDSLSCLLYEQRSLLVELFVHALLMNGVKEFLTCIETTLMRYLVLVVSSRSVRNYQFHVLALDDCNFVTHVLLFWFVRRPCVHRRRLFNYKKKLRMFRRPRLLPVLVLRPWQGR